MQESGGREAGEEVGETGRSDGEVEEWNRRFMKEAPARWGDI